MNLWLKIRVWTKIIFFAILAIYVLLFMIFNLGTKTTLWLYPSWLIKDSSGSIESSVLLFALGSFFFGVICTLLVRTIWRTLAQLQAMKRKKLEKEASAMVARAAKLRVRDVAAGKSDPAFPVVQAPDPSEPH